MTGPAPTGAVLAPLRQRYARWLGLDPAAVVADRDSDVGQVRAMQLVLRLERTVTPSWHVALALAATGAARICLDPRSEPGGDWFDAVAAYCAGHIRKVTRRGRGAQWTATAALPGVTLTDGATEVRALVPGPVAELDKRVAKLQVGGTDLPVDEPPVRPAGPGVLSLLVPADPPMTAGKQMAQAGHAGMIAAALMAGTDPGALAAWAAAGCPTAVRRAGAGSFARLLQRVRDPLRAWQQDRLLAVRDAGFTEIAPGTVTVVAGAPVAGGG